MKCSKILEFFSHLALKSLIFQNSIKCQKKIPNILRFWFFVSGFLLKKNLRPYHEERELSSEIDH